MTFKYTMTIERDGEVINLNPVIEFGKESGNYYGNGYHMLVKGIGFEPCNAFDIRYDKKFNEDHIESYFPEFAKEYWDGENGMAKLISIEEVK